MTSSEPWELAPEWEEQDVDRPSSLAFAAVVLTSLWLWWLGTFVGILLALISLLRQRNQPNGASTRRWAVVALSLGAVGLASFMPFAPTAARDSIKPIVGIRNHFEDSAARASLTDLVREINGAHGGASTLAPVAAGAAPTWEIPGGSRVRVVGPTDASDDFKTVSVEVWGIGEAPAGPGEGTIVYAAALSSSGSCWYLRLDMVSQTQQLMPLPNVGCDADAARDFDWSTTPGASGSSG